MEGRVRDNGGGLISGEGRIGMGISFSFLKD